MNRSLLLACALLFVACKDDKGPGGKGAGGPPKRGDVRFPVEVAQVEVRNVEYTVRAIGSVEAFERVHIAARVAGAVEEVRFVEGQVVKKGETLALIETSRYDIAVRATEAQKTRVDATLLEAKAGLSRRESAVKERPDLIPVEELDTWRTKVLVAEAQAQEANAALAQAQLNARSARPWALEGGVIESRNVETGQYVQPGTLLATLVRRDPLLLRFKVPERDAAALTSGMTARANADSEPITAKISHVGQVADANSRMVQVVAEIDDGSKACARPGSFAEVTVPVGGSKEALVVPELAVRPSERGFVAFVVNDDTAHERVLSLGLRTADGKVEITQGLEAGDLLVVRGGEALFEGAKVRVAEGVISKPRAENGTTEVKTEAAP